jgi:flagellar hook assembly protein FlgD
MFIFELPREMNVQLRLFNILGQEVRLLTSGTLPAGEHRITWDGMDDMGNILASGLYFAQIELPEQKPALRKVILMK